jgi:hypothetical protein
MNTDINAPATRVYPKLLGFTGRAGHGKSAAADIILQNHVNVLKFSFAQPLKKMFFELIRETLPRNPSSHPNRPSDYIRNRELKEEPMAFLGGFTPRQIMQTLGTEWGREALHKDFWVGIAAARVERTLGHSYRRSKRITINIIFDDVRFENEAQMIRAFGGEVVHVIRPDAPNVPHSDHASEKLDFEPDRVIYNEGTLQDLRDIVLGLYPPREITV